jgi:hypothetical protein
MSIWKSLLSSMLMSHKEIEREVMSCDFVTDHRLVGVSSKYRWEITAKIDVLVLSRKS